MKELVFKSKKEGVYDSIWDVLKEEPFVGFQKEALHGRYRHMLMKEALDEPERNRLVICDDLSYRPLGVLLDGHNKLPGHNVTAYVFDSRYEMLRWFSWNTALVPPGNMGEKKDLSEHLYAFEPLTFAPFAPFARFTLNFELSPLEKERLVLVEGVESIRFGRYCHFISKEELFDWLEVEFNLVWTMRRLGINLRPKPDKPKL